MADVHWKFVRGNLVFYDTHDMRWIDAYGPNVIKWELPRTGINLDDSTAYPTGLVATFVDTGGGSNALIPGVTAGTALQMTTAQGEYDGVAMTGQGTSFQLAAGKPLYFGANFWTDNASKADIIMGLGTKITTLLHASTHVPHAGLANHVSFIKGSDTTGMKYWAEKAGAATSSSAGTIAASTNYTAEFYYDGSSSASTATVTYFFSGSEVGKLTAATNRPTAVMGPIFGYRTGESAANVGRLNWMRVIQLDT